MRKERYLAPLICLAAAVALTWPMAATFTSRLGGDPGDPFQTLWSWRWLHDALTSLRNPFFTDRVFFPHGASLVFQTFDLPTALLTLPLWHLLPPAGVYNAGVLFAFWLTAYGMYRLARELSGDFLVSICAGILFCAAPYHMAHASGHLHLASMGWLPLYLVHLHRLLEGPGKDASRAETHGLRDGVLSGLFLTLASLASWYHLLYALIATPLLALPTLFRSPRTFVSRGFLRQAAALAGTFLVLAGPLLGAILVQRAAEPVTGAHDALRFSADVQAFFFPNLIQRGAPLFGFPASRWTGNAAEIAVYAGYAVLVLALAGAVLCGARARAYLIVALAGAVLALGPRLHIGGRVLDFPLPYTLLEQALPQVEFMGVPARFGYLLYLGLVVSAALALAHIRAKTQSRALAAALAMVPTAMALTEYWPRPFVTTALEYPEPLLEWARDPDEFAVLDLSGEYRMMYHATLHRKPMLGGNLTRVPVRLERAYDAIPAVRALRTRVAGWEPAFERVDRRIDFLWSGAPDSRLPPDRFQVVWTGSVTIPRPGKWTFHLTSDDGARLELAGKVLDNGGIHEMRTLSGEFDLSAGIWPLRLEFEEIAGGAGVRLEWEGPGQERQTVPQEALRAPDGSPGLLGRYARGLPGCGFDPQSGRKALAEAGVRFVITGPAGHACLRDEVRLPEIYRGAGIRIYEVD